MISAPYSALLSPLSSSSAIRLPIYQFLMTSTVSLGYAEALLCFYNKKMKNQLDILKLHSTKGRKPEIGEITEEFPERAIDSENYQDTSAGNIDAEDE